MKQRAFTLVELIVTISIISILTGLATVSYSGIRLRGRDAQRQNDLNQISVALATYYSASTPSQYPASSGATPPARVTLNSTNDPVTVALEPNYIRNIPVDPVNTGSFIYRYQTTLTGSLHSDYTLFATFENKNNIKAGNGAIDGFTLRPQ